MKSREGVLSVLSGTPALPSTQGTSERLSKRFLGSVKEEFPCKYCERELARLPVFQIFGRALISR